MSKYAPLGQYLARQPATISRLVLSFEQVERILGFELPASAAEHQAWWANNTRQHPHVQVWLDAGWQTVEVTAHQAKRQVVFERI
jgi:hypothetical protein